MFRKSRPVPRGPSAAFPVVDATQADRLCELLDAHELAPTIDATEGPATDLATLSGSAGWDLNRSIWSWFAAWAEKAADFGRPFVAVRIAEFALYFHDFFTPRAGPAAMFLGPAEPDQRRRIDAAALEACALLEPGQPTRPDGRLTVDEMRQVLAGRLGVQADAVPERPLLALPPTIATEEEEPLDTQLLEDEELYRYYLEGQHAGTVRHDTEAELAAYEKAGARGHPPSMFNAGLAALDLGRRDLARSWFDAAVLLGHGMAAYNLAALDAQDGQLAKAVEEYRLAAERGVAAAYNGLGAALEELGDLAGSIDAIEAGASLGDPLCMMWYGDALLDRGAHMAATALPWFERAAASGNNDAVIRVGFCHLMLGDRDRAATKWREALANGDERAGEILDSEGMPRALS